MYPDLFTFPEALPLIGGNTVSSFGAFVSLAFVASGLIFEWGVERKGGDGDKAWNIVILAFIGGVVGAKLYWALWHMDSVARDPAGTLFSGSGLTWYGGFLLAVGMGIWGMRAMKMPLGQTLDATALALPVGIAVGRIGCFLVGDDYGRPTASRSEWRSRRVRHPPPWRCSRTSSTTWWIRRWWPSSARWCPSIRPSSTRWR